MEDKLSSAERRKLRRQLKEQGESIPADLTPKPNRKAHLDKLPNTETKTPKTESKPRGQAKPKPKAKAKPKPRKTETTPAGNESVDQQNETEQPKPVTVEAVPAPESEISPESVSGGWGDGGKYGPSGLTKTHEQRMVVSSFNWQNRNRFPLEKAVDENLKIVDAVDGKSDVYQEILTTTVEMMRSKSARSKGIGLRAGVQLVTAVQKDDHAKLRAELRPMVFTPPSPAPEMPAPAVPAHVDQSMNIDNSHRVVIFNIPDNGRDPQLKAQLTGAAQ